MNHHFYQVWFVSHFNALGNEVDLREADSANPNPLVGDFISLLYRLNLAGLIFKGEPI